VTFEVDASQLAYTNLKRELSVEPARIDVFVGLDSDDRSLQGSFQVTGAPRVVHRAERSFLSTAVIEPARASASSSTSRTPTEAPSVGHIKHREPKVLRLSSCLLCRYRQFHGTERAAFITAPESLDLGS
jgi:hypothetical protein